MSLTEGHYSVTVGHEPAPAQELAQEPLSDSTAEPLRAAKEAIDEAHGGNPQAARAMTADLEHLAAVWQAQAIEAEWRATALAVASYSTEAESASEDAALDPRPTQTQAQSGVSATTPRPAEDALREGERRDASHHGCGVMWAIAQEATHSAAQGAETDLEQRRSEAGWKARSIQEEFNRRVARLAAAGPGTKVQLATKDTVQSPKPTQAQAQSGVDAPPAAAPDADGPLCDRAEWEPTPDVVSPSLANWLVKEVHSSGRQSIDEKKAEPLSAGSSAEPSEHLRLLQAAMGAIDEAHGGNPQAAQAMKANIERGAALWAQGRYSTEESPSVEDVPADLGEGGHRDIVKGAIEKGVAQGAAQWAAQAKEADLERSAAGWRARAMQEGFDRRAAAIALAVAKPTTTTKARPAIEGAAQGPKPMLARPVTEESLWAAVRSSEPGAREHLLQWWHEQDEAKTAPSSDATKTMQPPPQEAPAVTPADAVGAQSWSQGLTRGDLAWLEEHGAVRRVGSEKEGPPPTPEEINAALAEPPAEAFLGRTLASGATLTAANPALFIRRGFAVLVHTYVDGTGTVTAVQTGDAPAAAHMAEIPARSADEVAEFVRDYAGELVTVRGRLWLVWGTPARLATRLPLRRLSSDMALTAALQVVERLHWREQGANTTGFRTAFDRLGRIEDALRQKGWLPH